MKYRIGDTIRLLDEKGEGQIKKVLPGNRYLVELEDGFEYQKSNSEIVLIKPGPGEPEPSEKQEELPAFAGKKKPEIKSSRPFEKSGRLKPLPPKEPDSITKFAQKLTPELVDLHIDKLVPDHTELASGEKLSLQLQRFEKYLDMGLEGKYKFIIFIHGIGTGVLKKEIIKKLKELPEISFRDADYRKFGFGATEVTFP